MAFSIALGGAISNLYDRLVRHYVVDYFSIQYGRLKKVVFNLGDLFIFLGAGLIIIIETIRAFKER
ncbi:signal peptidase II [Lacrimispora xylanisolvens]|uniref:signal peptidase II n=1 Tax=Lacrimispora xylanisolvens TaxID=384636 RepID=UPI0032E8038A